MPNHPQGPEPLPQFFGALTEHVPASLAIREAMRYVLLRDLLLRREGRRIWDVGCGDGSFWTSMPERAGYAIDGIELDPKEAALGQASGAFTNLCVADITRTQPEAGSYDLVLGNCSLEHIPDIREALVRMRQALRPNGQLILFVPAPQWTRNLSPVRCFSHLSHRMGMAFGYAVDGFFQHHHLYGHPVWAGLLASLGYENVHAQGLGGPSLNRFFARHLLAAAPEFVYKTLRGHYPGPLLRRRTLPAGCLDELNSLPLPADAPEVVEYLITADRGTA